MTREEAKEILQEYRNKLSNSVSNQLDEDIKAFDMAIQSLCDFFDDGNKWIPVSERLPDNTDPVNITWVNHNPEPYYTAIKDKPFTATGHYCNGRWWWYSVTCQDYLDEYGRCDVDAMDEDIEVIVWRPLPESYKVKRFGGSRKKSKKPLL